MFGIDLMLLGLHLSGVSGDDGGDQLHRDNLHRARRGRQLGNAGHLRLDHAHAVRPHPLRVPAARECAHHVAARPKSRDDVLHRGRRRPGPLAAPLLVLRPPRGVHPGAPANGDHQLRAAEVLGAQAVRVQVRRLLDAGHRRPELRRLGPPHVHRRDGPRLRASFMAVSLAIAIPSAVKTFNWITTMWNGRLR